LYIEFSYPIDLQKPVISKNINPPRVIARTRFDNGDKSNTSYLEIYAHTGTHIDSPWHFNNQGWRINDFEIGQFVFEKVVSISVAKEPWQPVELSELEPYLERIQQADALLINTSFAARYRESDPDLYLNAMPGLSAEAAHVLAGYPALRCVGVDSTSVENLEKNRPLGYPVHHAFLDRTEPIILLEDANLDALGNLVIKKMFLFPLRMTGLEASPVTAVAEI
jgi:kynurenine formamidase